MTLANQLTVLRLLLAPVVVVCILYGRFGWALGALVLAGLTDMMDGALARRLGENSDLGALLDPLADKVLIVSAVVTLAAPIEAVSVRIPAWVAILVLSRDATIVFVAGGLQPGGGTAELRSQPAGEGRNRGECRGDPVVSGREPARDG